MLPATCEAITALDSAPIWSPPPRPDIGETAGAGGVRFDLERGAERLLALVDRRADCMQVIVAVADWPLTRPERWRAAAEVARIERDLIDQAIHDLLVEAACTSSTTAAGRRAKAAMIAVTENRCTALAMSLATDLLSVRPGEA